MKRVTTKLAVVALTTTMIGHGCSSEPDDPPAAQTASPLVGPISPGVPVGSLPNELSVSADGAALHTIAIEVPPGRGGLQPSLALSYSSRAGNGILGVGWSLSGTSQIARCRSNLRRDRTARPARFDLSDRYCLDGTPLVLVSGQYGSAGDAEFRTEPDSFAKVVAHRDGADPLPASGGPSSWTVYTKDGRVMTYGATVDARRGATETALVDDTTTAPVLRRYGWALNRVADLSGNYMDYKYGASVVGPYAEFWLAEIDYTGSTASGAAPNRSVVFGYDAGVRPDPMTSYVQGLEIHTTRRLTRITTTAPSPAGTPMVVRTYALGYDKPGASPSPLSHRSLLTSLAVTDSQGVTLPPTRFTYGTATPTFLAMPATPVTGPFGQAFSPSDFFAIADVNGDGRDDVVHASGSQIVVQLGSASGLGAPITSAYPAPGDPLGELVQLTAYDLDGDGKTDLVGEYMSLACADVVCPPPVPPPYQRVRFLSNGTTFDAPVTIGGATVAPKLAHLVETNGDLASDTISQGLCAINAGNGCTSARQTWTMAGTGDLIFNPTYRALGHLNNVPARARFVDLDGDGSTDLLVPYVFSPNVMRYDSLTLSGVSPQVLAVRRTRFTSATNSLGVPLGANCTVFADVNGDGLPDAVNLQTGYTVSLNKGNGDFAPAMTTPSPSFTGLPKCWDDASDAGVRIVDYNQDGRQDILLLGLAVNSGEPARVLESQPDGTMIIRTLPFTLGGAVGVAIGAATPDLDGDGLFDVVQVRGGSLEVYLQRGGYTDLLVRVDNGLGALVRQVDYAPLTATGYVRGTGAPTTARNYLGANLVVTNEYLPNPQGGGAAPSAATTPVRSYVHSYSDALVDRGGDGWLGFATHKVVDVRGCADVSHEPVNCPFAPIRITRFDRSLVAMALTTAAGATTLSRYPARGMPVDELAYVRLASGVFKLTRTTTSYAQLAYGARAQNPGLTIDPPVIDAPLYFTYASAITAREYESAAFNAAADPFASADTLVPFRTMVTSSSNVDVFGNTRTVTVDHGGGHLTTTTRTFASDPVAWLVGRLLDEQVSSQATTALCAGGLDYCATRQTSFTYFPGTRIVKDAIRQPGGGAAMRCTEVTQRDLFGQPTAVAVTPGGCAPTASSRVTTTRYDSDGVFVTGTTDPAGLTTSQSVHPALGVVYSSTDPAGLTTTRVFDGFGNLLTTSGPDGSFERRSMLDIGASGIAIDVINTARPQELIYLDRLGHEVRHFTERFASGTGYSVVDTYYDALGRRDHVRRPYLQSAGGPLIDAARYTYDNAGRQISDCHMLQSGTLACKKTTYSQLTVDTCDEDLAPQQRVANPFGTGETTSVFPAAVDCTNRGAPVTTSFVYGAFGQLAKVTDAAGNVRTQHFDALGRRTELDDEDVGFVRTTYNAFDEVATQTDAAGTALDTSDRDPLGRVRRQIAPDGTDAFTYDAVTGRLVAQSRGAISTTYSYVPAGLGGAGQLSKEHWVVDGAAYDLTYGYDGYGRPATLQYPAVTGQATPFAIRYAYQNGILASVVDAATAAPIWTAQAVDAAGHLINEQLGNTLTTLHSYEAATGLLTETSTPGINYYPHLASYTYSPSGDMLTRTSRIYGVPYPVTDKTETFSYDKAHQLRSAQVAGGPLYTYTYDALGNTTSASDTMPGCTTQYGVGTPGPHALTSVTCAGVTHPLTYDARGNTTSYFDGNGTATLTYTSFGKAATLDNVSGGMRHTYDANHVRIKKERTVTRINPPPRANLSGIWGTTITIGPFEKRSGPDQPTTDFVHSVRAGGRVVAERFWRWTGSTGTVEWRYPHVDALGSPERVTDGAKTAVEFQSFDAFGGMRDPFFTGGGVPVPVATRDSFTGHPIDLELGLIDMGGRHYHAAFHRFLQPDSIVQAPGYGPSWNRYAYVFNNPLKYTDPTGHMAAVLEPRPLNENACGVLCNGGGFGMGMGDSGRTLLDDKGKPVVDATTAPAEETSTATTSSSSVGPMYAANDPDPSAPPPDTLNDGTPIDVPSEETVIHERAPRRIYFVGSFGVRDGHGTITLSEEMLPWPVTGANVLLGRLGYEAVYKNNATSADIKAAFHSADAWGVVFLGHGWNGGLYTYADDKLTYPSEITQPGANLRFMWTGACYAGSQAFAWEQQAMGGNGHFYGQVDKVEFGDVAHALGGITGGIYGAVAPFALPVRMPALTDVMARRLPPNR